MSRRRARALRRILADVRLQALVEAMRSAPEARRLDAVASVVEAVVSLERARREREEGLQPTMMRHAMQHGMAGATAGMSSCPMMLDSPAEDTPGDDTPAGNADHAGHH